MVTTVNSTTILKVAKREDLKSLYYKNKEKKKNVVTMYDDKC